MIFFKAKVLSLNFLLAYSFWYSTFLIHIVRPLYSSRGGGLKVIKSHINSSHLNC